MISTLPVLMALSWVPAVNQAVPVTASAPMPEKGAAQSGGTITCPITGNEIPSCCCPLR
jgi:hypothetical protein